MGQIKTLADEPTRGSRNSNNRKSRSCSCIHYRKPLRIGCFIICMVSLISTIFVNYTKSTQECYEWTPSLLCIANRHCAFIHTPSDNFIGDMIPFMNENNKCVKRNELKDYMYKGVEKSIDLINTATNKVQTFTSKVGGLVSNAWGFIKNKVTNNKDIPTVQEVIQESAYEFLNDDMVDSNAKSSYRLTQSDEQKQKNKKILTELRYIYDDEIGLGMTRYEVGLWLITIGFFFLRKYLEKCGNEKNVFDFMHAKNQGQGASLKSNMAGQLEPQDSLYIKNDKGELQKLSMDQVRQIREQLLRNKQNEAAKKKQ